MQIIFKGISTVTQFIQSKTLAYAKQQAMLSENNKDYSSAIKYWRRCIDIHSHKPNIEYYNGLAKCLKQSGNFKDAENQYLSIYDLYPEKIEIIISICWLYHLKQDWKLLNKFSKLLLDRNKRSNITPDWAWFYVQSLIGLHRIDEAEDYFLAIKDSYTQTPDAISKLVAIAALLNLVDSLDLHWESILKTYPDNVSVHLAYINYLTNMGDYNLLKMSCNTYKNTLLHIPLYRCYMATYQFIEARECLLTSSLIEHDPVQFHLMLANNYMRCWDNMGLQDVLKSLLKLETNSFYSVHLAILLIQIYIRLGEVDKAISRLEQLDPWFASRQDVMELMSWRASKLGQHIPAKEININLLKNHYFHAVHASISIKRVDKRKMEHTDNNILLFSPMKDCFDILPWFLNYYRRLGVDYFFIIDNDSVDGTADYLLNQPDVYLFHTSDSFSHSLSGMRWINYLISKYAGNAWCLFVDSDEALVFPGVENSSLRNIVNYMESQGHEILSAFMLDMYPKDIKTLKDCHDISERINQSVYFDNNYRNFDSQYCPYRSVKGGIRNRIYNVIEILEKIPVIKAGRDIYYTGSHAVTHAVCSDITAVLLHYNIPFKPQLFEAGWNSEQDKNIRSRQKWCQNRYNYYSNINNSLAPNYIYLDQGSVKYESSKQLIKLGLMNNPDAFVY